MFLLITKIDKSVMRYSSKKMNTSIPRQNNDFNSISVFIFRYIDFNTFLSILVIGRHINPKLG